MSDDENEMTELEKTQARERAALTLKQERESVLASIEFPKRKTGEMSKLFAFAKSASAMLTIYDCQAAPPAFADLVSQCFIESTAGLNDMIAAAVAEATAKAAKAAAQ